MPGTGYRKNGGKSWLKKGKKNNDQRFSLPPGRYHRPYNRFFLLCRIVGYVVAALHRNNAMAHTIVMVAQGSDPPGLQYIAPYAATSMAEYFMNQGRDVLIVYDNLTRHALAYRQISLLLRRPPGREAFPGDIFYVHSRLLERSTKLADDPGGGSITSLPVIETEAQNISAYIPTNLISITDGQIYLSPDLFQKGILPAVDVGKSVSRVGGKAQLTAYRKVAGDLRLSYSQFQELEAFSRFGTRLDQATRKSLDHGRRVREILKQNQFMPMKAADQIAVLLAANMGMLDRIPLDDTAMVEKKIIEMLAANPDLAERIVMAEKNDSVWQRLEHELRKTIAGGQPSDPGDNERILHHDHPLADHHKGTVTDMDDLPEKTMET